MRVEIFDPNEQLDVEFGIWLLKRIQENFIIALDEHKLVPWDNFFNQSEDFRSIYNTPIKTCDILLHGVKNLVCDKIPNKLIIRFNKNQFVPGLDRVKVDTICRLINFGNLSVQPYPIFTTVLQEVAVNISEYVERYDEGII